MSGRGSCLVVMYHYVRDTGATAFPAIRALPPALFEQQVAWLQRHYTLVDLAALEAAIDGRTALPENAALLTFDDGFVDHYETVFPVLRARGIAGVFFLAEDACGAARRVLPVHKTHFLLARLGPAGFSQAVVEECATSLAQAGTAAVRRVFGADRWEHADERAVKDLLNYELAFDEADRVLDALFARHVGNEAAFARALYLDEPMIREMARSGMSFGYHTRSHRMLSRLSASEQLAEVAGGIAWVRRLAGHDSVSFCYPWGGPRTYTAETVGILSDCGYAVAFNTVRRPADVFRDHHLEIPRVDTRDLPPYTHGRPA